MRTEIAGPGYSSRAQRTLTLTGRAAGGAAPRRAAAAQPARGLLRRPRRALQRRRRGRHIFLGQAARVGLGLGVLTLRGTGPATRHAHAAPFLYAARRAAARRGCARRRRGHGRATLARPRFRALPALRDHEDRRAALLRVVPARTATAARFHDARSRGHDRARAHAADRRAAGPRHGAARRGGRRPRDPAGRPAVALHPRPRRAARRPRSRSRGCS